PSLRTTRRVRTRRDRSRSRSSLPFYCSCRPPARDSFPTRRSSDLGVGPQEETRLLGWSGVVAGGCACPDHRHQWHDADPQRHQTDRKSTRLNSSHEWISYAVFCLKEKNSCARRDGTRVETGADTAG